MTKPQHTILPEDTKSALDLMTTITRQMLELVLEEAKILKNNDLQVLGAIQKGKGHLADSYQRAADEFRARMNEFRALGDQHMEQLEALTTQLGKAIRQNQNRIEKISPKTPLKSGRGNTLYTLQEQQSA